jgi:hypothetical protein
MSAAPWLFVYLKYIVAFDGRNTAGVESPFAFQSPTIIISPGSPKMNCP